MTPMMNMYEAIRENLHFNKFTVGELLFVEYTCPIEDEAAGVWTPMDYFVHVLSGRKTWRTTEGTWTLERGQTLFFKKGGCVLYQDFKDDFCVLVFFVSDNFIRDVVREVSGQLSGQQWAGALQKGAILVNGDVALSAYFQSMLAYFTGTAKPAETLLTLKLKELIVSILLGEAAIPNWPPIFNRSSKAMRRHWRKSWRRIFRTISPSKISQNCPTAVYRPLNATSANATSSHPGSGCCKKGWNTRPCC
jgi:hypothetical protein